MDGYKGREPWVPVLARRPDSAEALMDRRTLTIAPRSEETKSTATGTITYWRLQSLILRAPRGITPYFVSLFGCREGHFAPSEIRSETCSYGPHIEV